MNENPETDDQPEASAAKSAKARRNTPRKLILAGIAVVALIIIGVLIRNPNNASKSTPSPAKSSAQVSIIKSKFVPEVIAIKTGDSVVWINQDKKPHWIASDPYPKNDSLKSLNSSGPLQQNETYTYVFDKTGTFTYHDQLNPFKLNGSVVVK